MKAKFFLMYISLALACPALKAQYTIYPVPHSQVAGNGRTSFTQQVNVVAESGIDEPTRTRLSDILAEHGLTAVYADEPSAAHSNIYIGVAASGGRADAMIEAAGLNREVFSVAGKYDRHLVSLSDDGEGRARLVVVGENTDAAFYGLASFEQMLDNGSEEMPCATLYDYADLQYRGLVEGYYGYPYSVSVKKDLMRFMMRHKMNTYLYGAKSDPYHSQYWQTPYPATITAEQERNGWLSQDMVRDISRISAETKVNFIWAIHPGNNFVGSSTVINDIMKKFTDMYNLGVRQFGVFVDDVGVPSSDADMALNAQRVTDLQHAMEAKWNQPGAAPADTIKPIHFVPQIYCRSFASSEDQFQRFFRALSTTPSHVVVYTTGYGVWSTPNSSDLLNVKQYLGRDVAWWWNYPCNDNADEQVYPLDMYSNFNDMRSVNGNNRLPSALEHGIGVASNPMQQGEVSKTALFSVADYTWNTAGFDNKRSWEASIVAAVGKEHAAAYRRLAPYISYNDPETLAAMVSAYKAKGETAELIQELSEVKAACEEVMAFENDENESLRLLYNDLRPWLLKLNQMFESALALIEASDADASPAERWSAYVAQIAPVEALGSDPMYTVDALEGMGSSISVSHSNASASKRTLTPFVEYLKQNALGKDFFARGEVSDRPDPITNVEGARVVCPVATDGVYYLRTTGDMTLEKGDYVGIVLPQTTRLNGFALADTLRTNYAVLYSADGKLWTRVQSDTMEGTGQIFARYLLIQNESDTPRSLKLVKDVMNLSLPLETKIVLASLPSGNAWDGHTADLLIDGDYDTFSTLNRNQAANDSYTVTLSAVEPVYDVRVCFGTTNGDYPNEARVQVSVDGNTWTNIPIKGTTTTLFTLSHRNVVKYSDDMSYCDFNAAGRKARYVRLYLSSPKTSKWCRIYEIEVNRQRWQESFVSAACDASGTSIPGLTDGVPYTGCTQPTDSIVYSFQNMSYLKGVTLYCHAAAVEGAEVAVTLDGSTWIPVARITADMQEIDLSDYPAAVAMSIRWNGATPAVYEIVETPDPDSAPVVSTVGAVPFAPSTAARSHGVYDLSGHKSRAVESGLYIENGRKTLRVRRAR